MCGQFDDMFCQKHNLNNALKEFKAFAVKYFLSHLLNKNCTDGNAMLCLSLTCLERNADERTETKSH